MYSSALANSYSGEVSRILFFLVILGIFLLIVVLVLIAKRVDDDPSTLAPEDYDVPPFKDPP